MRALTLLVLVVGTLVACDKSPKSDKPATAAAPSATATATAPAATAAKPAEAAKGQSFGAGVKLDKSTPIDAILTEPTKFAGQTVRVEGMVTDVCEMRGCWFEMAGEKPGQKLRFKVTDGEMVFPVDAKGKHAIAEGVVAVKELTLEQTREMAAEEAREKGQKFDPASVTVASRMVRIDGTGALMN